MRLLPGTIVFVLGSCSAIAQNWQIGVLGGYGWLRNSTISNNTTFNPPTSASVGFPSRATVGVLVGETPYRYWGGEIRWMYQWGGPEINWNGTKTSLPGFSNLITYDFMVYPVQTESGLRPYLAGGAGAKIYTGSGRRFLAQLPTGLAVLRSETEAEPAVSLGGGLKYQFARHAQARIDFRTYLTPVPDSLIRPVGQAFIHGWLADFVPTIGVFYTF